MRVCPNELSLRFAIACCALATMASTAQAETWRCTKPDGSVVYSDQNRSGECRKLEALPPLLRVPSVPPVPAEEGKPEAAKPALPEPAQVPTPGRGRRIDPPSDAIITIRDLKAVPNFNSLLGIANFQATMRSEEHTSELQSLAYLVCRL